MAFAAAGQVPVSGEPGEDAVSRVHDQVDDASRYLLVDIDALDPAVRARHRYARGGPSKQSRTGVADESVVRFRSAQGRRRMPSP
ncbi:hypothetical protein [Nocardia brevicatena]|uniref:hypothetical protein n=1 Tax=Nocardia brevicatena TaxID=37327 RepID=UPI0002EAB7EA|nr:hypothetical protein [Nocardia brevicatena]